jgi:arylsulfatase A-like enzyme
LLSVDDMVAAIISALSAAGRWRSCHMPILGDNGYSLGALRIDGKVMTYPDASQIPFAWRGPGIPDSGQTRDELVSNVDVPATLCELMGLEPGRRLEGRSLAPLLRGETPPWRQEIVSRNLSTWTIRTADGWYYSETDTPAYGQETELYTPADPWTLQNVAGIGKYASRQRRLADRLALYRSGRRH